MQDQAAAPSTPQAPSLSDQIQQYISTLPSILSAQQQYGPAFEQQNLALQQQYAPQYKALQDSLYPELAKLRTQLTNQATTGAQNGGLTDAMRQQYQDQFRAEVGDNNGSGIAGDYVSRGLINQAQQYQQYNQNLGLSLLGQQPLYQAQQSSQSFNANQGYNAGNALNYGANTYGNYVGSYANMYGTNASMYNSNTQFLSGLFGGAAGGAGSYLGAAKAAKIAAAL